MRLWQNLWLLMIFGLGLPPSLVGQLHLIVDAYPDFTPADATLYLGSSLNDWEAGHPEFVFQKFPDGTYRYTLPESVAGFEYKITRGDWSMTECAVDGGRGWNRVYRPVNPGKDTIRIQVENWWDLRDSVPYREKLDLRIIAVPEKTPPEANIYVAGSFNGWATYDERYRMERLADGTFSTQIPIREDVTDFKFNRGDWGTVEGRPNGLARPNRKYIVGVHTKAEMQQLEIESWEDLANRFNWYTLFIMLAVLQCFLLVIAINSLDNQNRRANLILSLLILLISAAFLARLWAFRREVFNEFPKLFLFPDLIYFLYGPMFFLYIRSLLALPKSGWRTNLAHFIPAVLLVIAYLPLLFEEQKAFIDNVLNLHHKPYFITASLIGVLFSSYYWLRGFRVIQTFRLNSARNYSYEPNIRFLQTVMIINAASLIVWLATFVLGGVASVLEIDCMRLTEVMIDTVWIMIAVTVYATGYYVMRQPQIFQLIDLEKEQQLLANEVRQEKVVERHLSTEEEIELRRLKQIMEEEAPYLNPRLTLPELATLTNLPVHQLSRIINEGENKNFYDFVNSYRVAMFKQRITQGEHEQHTLLSIALEVGFNSKTAFNRAFKKLTQTTPREFLKAQEAERH